MTSRRVKPHWTLDRKVPLALVLAIAMQTGGIVWWAAITSSRIEALERASASTAPQGDRLTRVEVKLEGITEKLGEIMVLLRRP